MQANKRNLSELLSQDIRLVAPLFQRPYVWKKDENWEPLWFAISELTESRLSGNQPRPYFLGALVLDQVPHAVGEISCREIIDGQQRMTTLQILMRVARAVFENKGLSFAASQMARLTRNDLENASDEQFKVWPTNIDREAFKAVMLGQSKPSLFQDAADFFVEKLVGWLGLDDEIVKAKSDAFVQSIKNDLVFVAIDLDSDDDGQLIFETLNSLGTPLLPSDLVKNLLFRQAIVDELDTDNLYEDHWKMFEVDMAYWREGIKVGRRERPRLDIFLQHYLTYKLRSEPLLAHQFRDYRDAFKAGDFGTTTEAIADFCNHASLYKEFDTSLTGSPGSLCHALKILDISVLHPLVLGIYARAADPETRDQMLAILESYVMRRFLCAQTTKNYNRLAADLITYMNEKKWRPELLDLKLCILDGPATRWPTDEQLTERVTTKASYNDLRKPGIGYVLGRIEAHLRDGGTEVPWNPRAPLTIEHILPQNWVQNWPLSNSATEEDANRRDEMKHLMGNLTVLTRKLNSEASNSAWPTKRKKLLEHTVLRINIELSQMDEWNEDAIEQRGQILAQRFCEIWPCDRSYGL